MAKRAYKQYINELPMTFDEFFQSQIELECQRPENKIRPIAYTGDKRDLSKAMEKIKSQHDKTVKEAKIQLGVLSSLD